MPILSKMFFAIACQGPAGGSQRGAEGETPRLLTRSLLAIHRWDSEAATVFTTADPRLDGKNFCRRDIDQHLLVYTQAYLKSLAAKELPAKPLCRAWEHFFAFHDPLIRTTVQMHAYLRRDREDCVQEVWIEIVRRLIRDDYNPRLGRFSCWIFTVIRNKVIDLIRAAGRKPSCELFDLEAIACHRVPDPAVTYERQQKRRIVRDALTALR